MSGESTIDSKHIYKGRVLGLRVDTVRLPDGSISQREIVEHGGSVAIVPLDDQGNVLMVRQFRKAIERALLEVPAGTLEPSETPEEGARRELEEETGFRAGELVHLATFYLTPGFCTEVMHAFLATNLQPVGQRLEADEDIEVAPVALGQVLEKVRSGEICDAKSIASLLLTLRARESKRADATKRRKPGKVL